MHSCTQCPQPCSRPPPTHASARDSWALMGKSGSVSCGVTASFFWVLLCTRFCLCPPRASYPYPSEGRQDENHNHRKLNNLITWTTTLSNSMKLWATQDGWIMVESSDKTWSTGDGNGKQLQYSCLENSVNNMKRRKDMTLKDELPRSVDAQYATGEEWRNKSRKK